MSTVTSAGNGRAGKIHGHARTREGGPKISESGVRACILPVPLPLT